MLQMYKHGYSTLPNLRKLGTDEVFERDESESEPLSREKKDALKNQEFFFEHEHEPKIYEACAQWIGVHHPRKLSGSFLDIAKEAEEDFMIHRAEGLRDWLSSAHVCFPSHWDPAEKVGRSFDEIHQPVPMNLKNSKKLVHAMIHGGAFERFVWSVIHEKRYNFHPRLPYKKFDPDSPEVHVKIERQVTVGFPEQNFCLFILRQYLITEEKLDKEALASSIEGMTDEQRSYKGLTECGPLVSYLRS